MRATAFHDSVHLGENDVYPAIDQCPICLSSRSRSAVFTLQEAPTIVMLECVSCRGCSASHMPNNAVLEQYYARYYEKSNIKTTTPNTQRLAQSVVSGLNLSDFKTVRILDFGGGDGSVALTVADNIRATAKMSPTFEIDVVDYGEIEPEKNAGMSLRGHRDLSSVSGTYDLMMASAVLEHIPLANETIKSLLKHAAAGSYFYARTPYMLPLARLLGKLDLTYPAHVHDLGAPFWNRFISTFGVSGELIFSRPSVVESVFSQAPARTLAAYLMKAPAQFELFCRNGKHRDPLWPFVGGWEAMIRFT